MAFDLHALTASVSGPLKLVLFLALFLVVRGTPAVLLYRRVLAGRDRAALALFAATRRALVVAVTTVAVSAGQMRASTAAALVGVAVLSTLLPAERPAPARRPRRAAHDPDVSSEMAAA